MWQGLGVLAIIILLVLLLGWLTKEEKDPICANCGETMKQTINSTWKCPNCNWYMGKN
jgi:tRNA(Ile2) C34 agmatinyltransferase TiaS